jgi:hypothetical protein
MAIGVSEKLLLCNGCTYLNNQKLKVAAFALNPFPCLPRYVIDKDDLGLPYRCVVKFLSALSILRVSVERGDRRNAGRELMRHFGRYGR